MAKKAGWVHSDWKRVPFPGGLPSRWGGREVSA